MYLAAIAVHRGLAEARVSRADEVEGALAARLAAGPVPEHFRIRREEDRLTIACFLAGSGTDAEAQLTELHHVVRSVLTDHPGWVIEPRPDARG